MGRKFVSDKMSFYNVRSYGAEFYHGFEIRLTKESDKRYSVFIVDILKDNKVIVSSLPIMQNNKENAMEEIKKLIDTRLNV